jgi:hypothetical protein
MSEGPQVVSRRAAHQRRTAFIPVEHAGADEGAERRRLAIEAEIRDTERDIVRMLAEVSGSRVAGE